MQETLLIAGIACILAAIVGGSLKAFSVEIPALESTARKLALAALGVLFLVGVWILEPREVEPIIEPTSAPLLEIYYGVVGGPFVILGANADEGQFAPNGQYWLRLDIRVESSCANAVHIDRTGFSLYLDSGHGMQETFRPSIDGWELVPDRMRVDWLDPEESTEGDVIFQIPEEIWRPTTTYQLRYPEPSGCRVIYHKS